MRVKKKYASLIDYLIFLLFERKVILIRNHELTAGSYGKGSFVRCGGVYLSIQAISYADFYSIVVAPKAVEHEVFEKAQQKEHHENLSRKALLEGKSLRQANDKYKTH